MARKGPLMVTKLDDTLKRYTSISAVIDMLCRKELALLDPQTWDDRNDRYFMALYKEHAKASGLYAACFTQVVETYHHWRVFSGAADGACVEFKRSAFEKHIEGNPDLHAGEVRYLSLEQAERLKAGRPEELPFMKRIGFEPEVEYRVIAKSGEQQLPALTLPIDLKLIRRVYINPWLPDSIFRSVKSVLSDIDGCSHIKISRSGLIDSQRWKNAGNQVVGKPKVGRLVLKVGKKPSAPKPKTGALSRPKPKTR
jgi:hypothetical protein